MDYNKGASVFITLAVDGISEILWIPMSFSKAYDREQVFSLVGKMLTSECLSSVLGCGSCLQLSASADPGRPCVADAQVTVLLPPTWRPALHSQLLDPALATASI